MAVHTEKTTAAVLHTLESFSEKLIFDAYNLDADDINAVICETGTPAGWFPLLHDYDTIPTLPADPPELPSEVPKFLERHVRQTLAPKELAALRVRLRGLYEAGPGVKEEIEEADNSNTDEREEDEEALVGAHIPIPPETFLEELSQKLEIHPISVYWLLKEGIEKEGWRCLPEERRLTADRFTVILLRLLGHRWPRQIEAGETVPEWADADGVIPITEGAGEPTLLDRVRQCIGAEFEGGDVGAVEREFAEIMGKPMDQWLTTEFFKHHTRQFKKRPIAWQVQSGRFTPRKKPAFACLVYYHKLDGAALPTIQSQYVRPLRQRYETELRGIEAIPVSSRSDRQKVRQSELGDLVQELRDFDERLERVATAGFDTLRLRQDAVDDATLSLKSQWLKRLSQTLQPDPLRAWQARAKETCLHPDLPRWIAEALTHLNHHCASVGPSAPGLTDDQPDPTATDLARIIQPHAQAMIEGSLRLACEVWWKSFEEAVLDPIRERIREANEQIKTLEEERKGDPAPSAERAGEIERLKKKLKAEVKVWKQEREEKAARAQGIRDVIEAWTCPEALTWSPWLEAQPLYDGVASIDGKRQPPRTIQEFIAQERSYTPDLNDGVRVNIAPLQKVGLLADDALAGKDLDRAIADRAEWRADERRWSRQGKLPRPGWWKVEGAP